MLCDSKSYGVKHCLYKSYKYLMNGESHFISHYWLDCVRASFGIFNNCTVKNFNFFMLNMRFLSYINFVNIINNLLI